VLPTPSDPTGGVFVLNRLRALGELTDLSIVQPVPFMPLLRPLPSWARSERTPAGIEYAPMFYLPGALKRLDGRWLERSVRPSLQRLNDDKPLDLIDAHFGYPDGVGCAAVGRRLGIPVFVTIRGVEAECIQQPTLRGQLLGALDAAAGCISVSHSLRDIVVANGVDPAKIAVIHNAIDTALFCYGDAASARKQLGIAPGRRLVVSVGSLLARKRHAIAIGAAARLKERGLPVDLAIIGGAAFEPDEPNRLKALVRKLGVAEEVRFIGGAPQSEVVQWLRAADAFALASAREGCCNAVLEALAVGVPTVVTSAGDNARFVTDGVNGYVTPVDDEGAFADRLEAALKNGAWERQRIARRLFEQVGDWGRVAKRVADFFSQQLAALRDTRSRTRAQPC